MSHTSTYICAQCKEEFIEIITEEEANAEALELWGVANASNQPGMVRICDDCFKLIMERHGNRKT